MPDHISREYLTIGLAATFGFRFVVLLIFLWIMIQFQKMNFTWLPLIGAAFLAAALDMVPLVGHYIAVPALYLCIWKITNADIFPDAVFTVVVSYAMTYCLTLVLLAYAPIPGLPHTASTSYNFDDTTNASAVAVVQSTNQVSDATATPDPADSKIAADISIAGVSGLGKDAIVTIQYNRKDYSVSADEGVTLSTDSGIIPVHLQGADEKEVELEVGSQTVKYPVK